jgi:hypothetical protein
VKATIPALLGFVLPTAPIVVHAQTSAQLYYSTNADGSVYTYNTNTDGSANIVGYSGPPWVVTVPTNIDGLTVTSIGDDAFGGCTSLTEITVEAENLFYISVNGVLFETTQTTLLQYPAGGSGGAYVIPGTTVYYLSGAAGWAGFSANAGLPAVLWNPLIQVGDGGIAVRNSQFGFNITGTNNFKVVVEASTDLASSVWTPLQTVTLTNGSFYFSDPQWTNYSSLYYSLQMP